MKPIVAPALAAALAAGLALPVHADVTPREVWQNLQAYAAVLAGALEGQVTGPEDALTITEVSFSFTPAVPSEGLRMSLGDIALTALGDGRVQLGFAETQQIEILEFGTDEPERFLVQFDRPGLEMIASGEPDDISYSATADSLLLELREVDSTDLEEGRADFQFRMAGEGVRLDSRVATGDQVQISNRARYNRLGFTLVAQRSEERAQAVEGTARNAELGYELRYQSEGFAWRAFQDALRDGLDMRVSVAAERTEVEGYDLDPIDGGLEYRFVTRDGEGSYALNADGFYYSGSSRGLDFDIPVQPDIPLAFGLTTTGTSYAISMPLFASDGAPGEMAFDFEMTDLGISDSLWDLIDPAAILPRAPMQFTLASTIGVAFDGFLFGMLADDNIDGRPDLETLDVPRFEISTLKLDALGALFEGQAAFDVDLDDMDTFPDMPAMTGRASFRLDGIHGLIDRLIEAELLDRGEALGMRAVIGMVTAPTDAPDSLTSEIEMDAAAGTITANGLRIQ